MGAEELEGEDGAHSRRGQRGENGHGVDVALVEHPEDDVDGDERGQDEKGLGGQRGLEGLGRALEARPDGGGQPDLPLGVLDGGDGVAEGDAGGEVEGQRHRRKLPLVIDGERGGARHEAGEGGQGHLRPRRRLHVDALERVGIFLVGGQDLEHHVVLVQLGVDGRDLALAEGVVQGVVDELRYDAQP